MRFIRRGLIFLLMGLWSPFVMSGEPMHPDYTQVNSIEQKLIVPGEYGCVTVSTTYLMQDNDDVQLLMLRSRDHIVQTLILNGYIRDDFDSCSHINYVGLSKCYVTVHSNEPTIVRVSCDMYGDEIVSSTANVGRDLVLLQSRDIEMSESKMEEAPPKSYQAPNFRFENPFLSPRKREESI